MAALHCAVGANDFYANLLGGLLQKFGVLSKVMYFLVHFSIKIGTSVDGHRWCCEQSDQETS
jgi:hypothetical protein